MLPYKNARNVQFNDDNLVEIWRRSTKMWMRHHFQHENKVCFVFQIQS